MFTPIHRALGLEPGAITPWLVQQAVAQGVEETSDLDWKQSAYDSRRPDWQDKVAKDFAAMANSGGGWIVLGVREDGEANAATEITPVQWDAREQQRFLQTAYARIGPPVVGLEFFPLEIDSGSVVMVHIPDSQEAPHFARKGNNAFVAPRRNGPHTVFLGDREIEQAFRLRFRQAEEREQRLQFVFEQAGLGLEPGQGVSIVLVAVPGRPLTERQPMDEGGAYTFFANNRTSDLVHPGAQHRRDRDHGQVRKGVRQWISRSAPTSTYSFRKAIHDDGAAAASYRLGNVTDRQEAAPYYPVGLPSHCMGKDIESAIIDFFGMLRLCAAARRVHGGYRVRVGLLGPADEPIFVRTGEGGTNLLLDVEHSEPIHRFIPITVDLDPLDEITATLPLLNDLAKDVLNQGGVKYLKVMAEPEDFGSA